MLLGEVMATTEHRGVGIVMGYFQAGSLLQSRATALLAKPVSGFRRGAHPLGALLQHHAAAVLLASLAFLVVSLVRVFTPYAIAQRLGVHPEGE
ncbi:hypothetical protein [Dyella monticola]|uniref:hypothetical protein n=1 Tax=Dyella monticola TaxID=1927958 RepID=UPI0026CDB422|nr:hypothetical protein [Dyella monticola]